MDPRGIVLGGLSFVLASTAVSCSDDSTAPNGGAAAGSGGSAGSGLIIPVNDAASDSPGPWQLPPGFTPGTRGGYKLGDPVGSGAAGAAGATDGGAGQGGGCGTIVTGVLRDFKGYGEDGADTGHQDFEDWCCGDDLDIVDSPLGADKKPPYKNAGGATPSTHGKDLFDQWYRSVDGVNKPYYLQIALQVTDPAKNIATFESSAFFPVDNAGFGNAGNNHNFHFTTELHLQFRYNGQETFKFTGDDDVFVYVNSHLAINLGGVHGAEDQTIELDDHAQEFGISKGNVYDLDLFHAERHTSESNFRIDTTLEFVNCGTIVPDPH
ncbi:MAG: fibro-slime domain-containing protein [Deltaproteobacteria bacterium]|nr:fibro-slime domain-containing protein [Deltaproteobacteria bacterium]